VIEPGDRLPPVTVWIDPGGRAVALDGLAADGPILLLFYLFDWTPT
jgi:peroxiredoxin